MAGRRSRSSNGRQKIPIKRIENEEARQVCFSKRRNGLFKKASELSILCGAHVAAVVFSPAGKAFSFGHPSVEAIMERFLPPNANAAAAQAAAAALVADPALAAELNKQYGEVRAVLEKERARRERAEEALEKERAEGEGSRARAVMGWLHAEEGSLTPDALLAFGAALAEVQGAVAARADHLLRDALLNGRARAAHHPLPHPPLHMDLGAFGGAAAAQMPPPPLPGFGVDLQPGFGPFM
ncbi:hypothetical protein ACP4OV_020033 [Aristida adscensionis]